MMGPGEYVCGLEPSTHEMTPTRRELREKGLPAELAPGASVDLRLEIGTLPDARAIAAFEGSRPPSSPGGVAVPGVRTAEPPRPAP